MGEIADLSQGRGPAALAEPWLDQVAVANLREFGHSPTARIDIPANPVPHFTATLHKLWRSFPRGLRRRLIHGAIDLVAPSISPASELRPGPIIVGGLLSTASGLGEGARLCLDALHRLGWDAQHADLSSYFLRPDLPAVLPGSAARAGEGGTLILHINGPYTPYAMMRLGKPFLAGRRIIGNWAWELPRMGPDWKRGLRHVHEVWVSSRFIANALPAETKVPVKIVPYPVCPPAVGRARDRFGLGPDIFVVLTAFDMGSSYARKNPRAAVAAFRRAFGDDPNALLLLKVGNPTDASWAMHDLNDAIAGMTNVRLMQQTLSRIDMASLVATADVVLSLHRAEGFGLLMAEAMLLGVPAVATGWSGNLDFMTSDNSILIGHGMVPVSDPQGTYTVPGTSWADPNVHEAADWLVRLRREPELRATLAERARITASEYFSPAAYRRAIGDSLPEPGAQKSS